MSFKHDQYLTHEERQRFEDLLERLKPIEKFSAERSQARNANDPEPVASSVRMYGVWVDIYDHEQRATSTTAPWANGIMRKSPKN